MFVQSLVLNDMINSSTNQSSLFFFFFDQRSQYYFSLSLPPISGIVN